MKIDLNML